MNNVIQRKWVTIVIPENWTYEIQRADVHISPPSNQGKLVIITLKSSGIKRTWDDVDEYSKSYMDVDAQRSKIKTKQWEGLQLDRIVNGKKSVSWRLFSGEILILGSLEGEVRKENFSFFKGIVLGITPRKEGGS